MAALNNMVQRFIIAVAAQDLPPAQGTAATANLPAASTPVFALATTTMTVSARANDTLAAEESASGRNWQNFKSLTCESSQANRMMGRPLSDGSPISLLAVPVQPAGCTGTTSAHWLSCFRVGSCTGTGARVPVQGVLFCCFSPSTVGVSARTRRRSVSFRRDLIRWIQDFDRNPRSPYLLDLVKVSLVEFLFYSVASRFGLNWWILIVELGVSSSTRLGGFQLIQQGSLWFEASFTSLIELDRDTLHTRLDSAHECHSGDGLCAFALVSLMPVGLALHGPVSVESHRFRLLHLLRRIEARASRVRALPDEQSRARGTPTAGEIPLYTADLSACPGNETFGA
uniref:Uncharacterized protein n=1 Tax=Ananas comosus var. bracteatus TaxID=296719 RepID=A0A6V7Q3K8_ANACO|nr:unnamed protein product [Ananas comosus var. bracteatus]